MAFDPTHIPHQMNRWTPEGIITCLEEVNQEIDFAEKYGVGAIFRMQLDCAVVCLVDVLSKGGDDKLTIIQQAEEAADDMMKVNGVPFMNESILRQIMADIYDSAEEAVRRWGE